VKRTGGDELRVAAASYDLIVIGGGSAGLVAAVGAAKLGARVALVERRALGGDCLYTGCVPSKALIAAARFAHETRRAASFGFAPRAWAFADEGYAGVAARVRRVVETVGAHDAPEVFRAEGVEVIFGTPRFRTPHEIEITPTSDGGAEKRVLRARRFCLSTGSRPAVPPVPGLEAAGFVTNEQVFELRTLPRALVVLGGGPVGLELGQAFARLGSRVTVVELEERLLPKEDEEVSAFIADALRAEGVEVLLRAKAVAAARTAEGRRTLTVEHDGARRELTCAEILVAAGRGANTEGLNLEAAGVRYDAGRVHTDAYLRTSARHVYAAGDVTGHFQLTHAAAYEAALVVRNALFPWPVRQRADFRVVPWAVFTDPEVARVGLTEREARARYGQERVRVYRAPFADNDRAQAEGTTKGFCKLVCAGRRDELVGAHLVGPHAGELIHEIVLAMKQRLPASALGGMIHAYPTLTQVTQRAALDATLARLAPYKSWLGRYFAWRR
jgi:pyruvate/2-oxoglutarate dehydrogenase complex dihydrolipoamide dehydrogenase (E3) component